MKSGDIAGERFGTLTAISKNGSDQYGKAIWKLRCDCGGWHESRADNLLSGRVKACAECRTGGGRKKGSPNVDVPIRFTVQVIKGEKPYRIPDDSTGTRKIRYRDDCCACVRETATQRILFRVDVKARERSVPVVCAPAALRLMSDHSIIGVRADRGYAVWAKQEGVEFILAVGTPAMAYEQWGETMKRQQYETDNAEQLAREAREQEYLQSIGL